MAQYPDEVHSESHSYLMKLLRCNLFYKIINNLYHHREKLLDIVIMQRLYSIAQHDMTLDIALSTKSPHETPSFPP